MNTNSKTFKIVRRAYSEYTVIEDGLDWLTATLRAMELQHRNQDGEYLAYSTDEDPYARDYGPIDQGSIAWL